MKLTDLKTILSETHENTFDAEHYSEWFMNGELPVDKIISLTDDEIVEVGDVLEVRWDDESKLKWFEYVLEIV